LTEMASGGKVIAFAAMSRSVLAARERREELA
jgi:hypothetical protein